jgi:hypothetical protein
MTMSYRTLGVTGIQVSTYCLGTMGLLSGKYRKGQPIDLASGRPALNPDRFNPSLPGGAAKFEAIEELVRLAGEIGRSLPQLAVAFPVAHPAVTSVIIGPRTMPQLDDLLDGASLALDDTTLDRAARRQPVRPRHPHPARAGRPRAAPPPARRAGRRLARKDRGWCPGRICGGGRSDGQHFQWPAGPVRGAGPRSRGNTALCRAAR